ncbi:unnamed protein product [Onchocerca flexuosa]|uniref:Uncharacterized protein n=1 Tax=Onchocerca flexuosa TaxID=387005 RepID=A0A183I0V3_9BILA|nr:unnamed protein product [Onchocerca flexuosa]
MFYQAKDKSRDNITKETLDPKWCRIRRTEEKEEAETTPVTERNNNFERKANELDPAHISYCDLAKKFFEVKPFWDNEWEASANKMISIHKKWKNNPLKETANDTCYIKSTEEKILTNEDVEFVIDFFLRTPWFK